MNIAVFADLHGRLLLCFKLCARWQDETGEQIDLILQAGDMGVYPVLSHLDRATIKHMRDDPTELGFSNDFVEYREEVAQILKQTNCPMIFVRGNHEDHDWLDIIEQQTEGALFPVDVYERIFCLKTGLSYTFQRGKESVNILGIGRIGVLPGDEDIYRSKYIQPYELERLYDAKPLKCDLLLSHDVALHSLSPNYGVEEIRFILDEYLPRYHFHGHTEQPFVHHLDQNGTTQVIKMADLHWDKMSPNLSLESRAMGILRWKSPTEHSFSVVDSDWFQEYNAKSWMTL